MNIATKTKHVSTCTCAECKKQRNQKKKELVKVTYLMRGGRNKLIQSCLRHKYKL